MVAGPGSGVIMVAYAQYAYDPRVRREAETLARLGHPVSVLCVREPGEPATETIDGVQVRRMPISIVRGGPLRYLYQYTVFGILAVAALRRMGDDQRPVALHIHSLPDFLAFAGLGLRRRGVPIVLDLHEGFPELFAARFPHSLGIGYRVAVFLQQASCAMATHVIVVNDTIKDLLIARGVRAERITVIYNTPAVVDSGAAVATFPLAASGCRLVYAGGVNEERDLETLLYALARLTPAALVVYGPASPEYEDRLRRLVRELALDDRVRFGGVIPPGAVLAYLAASDIGVVTYRRNPHTEIALPSKAFEYAFLNKPLVLPSLRTMRKLFEGAAFFYEPGQPADLAEKIQWAVDGGPQVRAMVEKARSIYEELRWETQARRLAILYPKPSSGHHGGGGSSCM